MSQLTKLSRCPLILRVAAGCFFELIDAWEGSYKSSGMSALFDRVLTLNLAANTAIFYVAARLYLLPLIPRLRPQQILVPILLLHSTRHLGMMFLTRGATYPGMPSQFAYPAAFGDMLTAIIALGTIPIVLRGSPFAKAAVWFFNIVGTIDLVVAITLATIYD